jgi:hypothetical protein
MVRRGGRLAACEPAPAVASKVHSRLCVAMWDVPRKALAYQEVRCVPRG